jgi:hypothetical protein
MACRQAFGHEIPENKFLCVYFNWFKGVDLSLNPLPEGVPCSESWPDYSVDLWVFMQYYESEEKKYQKAKDAQKSLKEQRERAEKQAVLQASTAANGKPVRVYTEFEKHLHEQAAKYEKKARA